ncbi:hypothetical protein [Aeromonas caviae]|uniref:hypothetical protein n=1 Tax=Aeromonas caviae TaxID=648 RepID=UPI0029DCCDA7|nr:hypothetical protein [Aeromonas caviae]MDX7853047.1 hypothetical protein [Aeromonas caviae]
MNIELLASQMSEIEADIELINAQLISFDAMSATEVEHQWYIGAKAARSAKQRQLKNMRDEYRNVVSDLAADQSKITENNREEYIRELVVALKVKANKLQRIVDLFEIRDASKAEIDSHLIDFRALKAVRHKTMMLEEYLSTIAAGRPLESTYLTPSERERLSALENEESTLLQECTDIQRQLNGYSFKNDVNGRGRDWYANATFTLKQKRLRIREIQDESCRLRRRQKNAVQYDFERAFVHKAKEHLTKEQFTSLADMARKEIENRIRE